MICGYFDAKKEKKSIGKNEKKKLHPTKITKGKKNTLKRLLKSRESIKCVFMYILV